MENNILFNIQRSFKEFDIIKARFGIYKDTPENRRLHRVGVKYGIRKDSEEDFDTRERHSVDGKYSAYRSKIHKAIFDKIVEGVKPQEHPTVTLIMGGSASGKGTASKYFRDLEKEKIGAHLDVDEIKKMLPEYNKFKPINAAGNVHEESSDIGKHIRNHLIENKMNFVNDATFSNKDKAVKLIKKLKEAGYKINLIAITTDIDEAKRREHIRFLRTGRHVPRKILEQAHIGGTETYVVAKDLVDNYMLADNNNGKDEPPTIVDTKKEGIVNKKNYEKFLNKANYGKG